MTGHHPILTARPVQRIYDSSSVRLCVCVCCVFIVQRVLYSETGITKRICFRLQSTRTVRKCQRRRWCSVRVCVFIYIYIYIWYRCKYITCTCILCIQYYIHLTTRVLASVCCKTGSVLQLLVSIMCVSVRGKHDRHLAPRPPCKKQFCSNLIDSTSRVMQYYNQARVLCTSYIIIYKMKTHTPAEIFVWVQVWPEFGGWHYSQRMACRYL